MTEKILLVWEEIPEKTTLFVLDASSEIAEIALASCGKYINADDVAEGDPVDQLNNRLGNDSGIISKHVDGEVVEGPFSKVTVCGFLV